MSSLPTYYLERVSSNRLEDVNSSRKSSIDFGRPTSSTFGEHDVTAVNSQIGDNESQKEVEDDNFSLQLERINSGLAEKVEHLPHHKDHDADLVDWDGPHDPENPQNFSFRKKVGLTALIILLTVDV
jgi:hypothetical protein